MAWSPRRPRPVRPIRMAVRLVVLLLPAALLSIAGMRSDGLTRQLFFLGVGSTAALALFIGLRPGRAGWPAVALLIVGLAGIRMGIQPPDEFAHLAQGILILTPLALFALMVLASTGATELRRAHNLARRLRDRTRWPESPGAVRTLPDVLALRAASAPDAGPVLPLLLRPSPQVRLAALSALEGRRLWRPGQAEFVAHVAQQAAEPEVRAAALAALSRASDRMLVEGMTAHLHDVSPLVR